MGFDQQMIWSPSYKGFRPEEEPELEKHHTGTLSSCAQDLLGICTSLVTELLCTSVGSAVKEDNTFTMFFL